MRSAPLGNLNKAIAFKKGKNLDTPTEQNIFYLRSEGAITITANSDFIVLDEGKIVALSLYDAPAVVDKIISDYKNNASVDLLLCIRGTANTNQNTKYIKFEGEYKVNTSVDPNNKKRKHAVITSTNINYAFNIQKEDKPNFLKNFIAFKHKTPCNLDNVNKNIDCFKTLKPRGHNDLLKSAFGEIYKLDILKFKGRIVNKDEDFLPNINSVNDFIKTFTKDVFESIQKSVEPLYKPGNKYYFENFKLKSIKGQEVLWGSGIEVLKKSNFLYLAAEMGSGKTLSSLVINREINENHRGKKAYSTFIIAPATTMKTIEGGWRNEIDLIMHDTNEKGEAVKIDYDLHIVTNAGEAKSLMLKIITGELDIKNPKKPLYIVSSKEVLKLGYSRIPSYLYKRVGNPMVGNAKKNPKNNMLITNKLYCPTCGEILFKKSVKAGIVWLKESDFFKDDGSTKPKIKDNSNCLSCGGSLHTGYKFTKTLASDTEFQRSAKNSSKNVKIALVDFFKLQGVKFDMVIVDEVHEGNNAGSLIGRAQSVAMRLGHKRMALSGTSNNGYASSMFNILRSIMPRKLVDYNVMDLPKFTEKFGIVKKVYKHKSEDDKKSGKVDKTLVRTYEEEGISPQLFTDFLAENYVFFQLKEIKEALPEYEETFIPIERDDSYRKVMDHYSNLMSINTRETLMFKDSIFKHMVNNPSKWEGGLVLTVPFTDLTKYVEFPEIECDEYLKKDYEALRLAKDAKARGRKFCICNYFNNGGKYMKGLTVSERLIKLFAENGIHMAWLKADSLTFKGKNKKVKNIDRESTLVGMKNEMDGFITEPSLINVGLNLKWCPTYINFMPTYLVNEISQANRRGWRLKSEFKNEVFHLYYKGTIEEEIINRFQTKKVESRAIEANFDVAQEEHKDVRTYSKGVKAILNTFEEKNRVFEKAKTLKPAIGEKLKLF